MTLAILLTISVTMLLIQAMIPFLVKRTVVFGVTIPERYLNEPQLIAYKKRYAAIILFLSLIALGAYGYWALRFDPTEEQVVLTGTWLQMAIIFISLSLYFYFHARTVKAKKTKQWSDNRKQIKIADLSIRVRDEMLPWHAFLLPILVTAGLMGYTILHYDALPDQIPTHWGVNGEPDAFTPKTPISAVSSSVIMLTLQAMFLFTHVGTKMSGVKLSASGKQASRVRQLMLRKYTSWFMFLVNLLITILFTYLQLSIIHPALSAHKGMIAAPMIILIAILAGAIFYAVKVGRSDKIAIEPESTDDSVMDLDEDAHWVGGLIYFNKNDPSIFVEKRFGVGWTLNLANPLGYLFLLVPLIIILTFTFIF